MSYKITITKTEKYETIKERRVDVAPYEDDGGYTRNHIYETVPTEELREMEIYTQVIDGQIDLVGIINAINKKTEVKE